MKKLLILTGFLWLAACTKVTNSDPTALPKRVFFKNAPEVFQLVKTMIRKFHADENLETIERISYLHSGSASYAFVFYRSNKGSHNLVITKNYAGEELIGGSVTKCEGENCDCKVRVVVGDDGHVDVGCSCSSCKTVTSNGLE